MGGGGIWKKDISPEKILEESFGKTQKGKKAPFGGAKGDNH